MPIRNADNIIDNQIDNIIDKNLEISPFSPFDLKGFQLWLDADFNVMNSAAKNVFDQEADIILINFPLIHVGDYDGNYDGIYLDFNALYSVTSYDYEYNNPIYSAFFEADVNYNVTIYVTGSNWTIEVEFDTEYSNQILNFNGTYTQNIYPWLESWDDGSVIRAAATSDVLATNNQTVEKWGNLIPNRPSLFQSNLNYRPTYRFLPKGKAVEFNLDSLSNKTVPWDDNSYFTPQFQRRYSYYFVGHFAESASGTLLSLGDGLVLGIQRGIFQIVNSFLVFKNGGSLSNTGRTTSIRPQSTDYATILSVRVDLNKKLAVVGRNFDNETIIETFVTSANYQRINLGSVTFPTPSAMLINSSLYEVLVYNDFHDNITAKKVIEYLTSKRNIRRFN